MAYHIGDFLTLFKEKNKLIRQKKKALNYLKKKGKLPEGFDLNQMDNQIDRSILLIIILLYLLYYINKDFNN